MMVDSMKQSAQMQVLLTAKEAAKVLSISPRKLWSLANCGKIPTVRIDRCVRYRPEDLADFAEECLKQRR